MKEHSVLESTNPDLKSVARRLPIGSEYQRNDTTHFRVWAPAAQAVEVAFEDGRLVPLQPEKGGYFSGLAASQPGDRYRFRLDGDRAYPDPASRYQPDGPHGPSEIVDPSAFSWTDQAWRGASLKGQVLYELHIGTFTREGTYAAARERLHSIADLGVTTIEIMPLAEFDGRFGWGYDGVDLFAPSHLYGSPDDLRGLIDHAHRLGLGVILDVVYNHFGPSGNYTAAFSRSYMSTRYPNEWGDAINFDGDDSAPVREFFIANAGYWIDEFHFDGLRLDATQQIFDASNGPHILTEVGRRAREAAAGRTIFVVAENEHQDVALVRPIDANGYGLDGMWNDDLHHSAMVAITGHREAYYSDSTGEPQEFISAAKYGFLFQGQRYAWQHKRRGTPTWGLPPWAFVAFLQNHDQVSNSGHGQRGHQVTSPGRWRAMTAYLLLGPETPMLFQGQEIAASAPFVFFANFDRDLAAAVKKGRAEFLAQFPSLVGADGSLMDPGDPSAFERCKIDWRELDMHRAAHALHADLIALRRVHASIFGGPPEHLDGCVLSNSAFALRYFSSDHSQDRVLLINLGSDLIRKSFGEPLLAPPAAADWHIEWSSEEVRYGGQGTPELWPGEAWRIPGECAVVLAPGSQREPLLGPWSPKEI
ncbi:MAG TPA: malto-oligosyltrehalose trehalohydrolase [Vicinamibacterales bacterium]|jgi:maltooligosyltrehalose trehalohydrolase